MKKIHGVYLVLIALIVMNLVSCASSPTYKYEPVSDDSTLVVGQINIYFDGFPPQYQLNGPHGSGLELTFEDAFGVKTVVKASGKNAMFGFEVDRGGDYRLTGIKFRNDRVSATISMNWTCVVQTGMVNNFGFVEGKWQHYGQGTNEVSLLPPKGHKELEQYFRERYPESGWNQEKWVGISFQ